MVAQGYTQEEGIDYDEVFAHVARIEEIRLFLAYASFMGFNVYQMDVKSAFLYGIIEEDVYVCQPPGFEDPQFPDKVYVGNLLLRLQVQQKKDGIFISQDKYVADILKKFDFATVKTASTHKELTRHWDSPFDLEAFSDSDYARASLDGKSTTRASVRRHLQLADVEGISALPTTEIFDQLSLMGYILTDDKLTFQKAKEGEGSGHPSEPQPPPSTTQPIHEEPIPNVTSEPIPNVTDEVVYQEWDDGVERATTTAASLDAAQASGNITKTQSTAIPNVPLPGIGAWW
ncbi:retrovirus-related pol polyprotein from transposon TNT 1-94 [Tanacetum coccineum]